MSPLKEALASPEVVEGGLADEVLVSVDGGLWVAGVSVDGGLWVAGVSVDGVDVDGVSVGPSHDSPPAAHKVTC